MTKTKFLRKKQLLKLVDRLPGTIYQYREWPDGRSCFPYSTRAIEAIFFTSPRVLSKDASFAWEKIEPDCRQTIRETLEHSAKHLKEFEATFQTRSPQDRLHWFHTHAIPERLRDGSTLWHGYMEDITAEHKAEEAAKQKAAMLEFIFENLPDQIYYMDRQSRILDVNPACCKHHARSAREMIGKTDLDLYPSEIGRNLYEEEQALMSRGKLLREREKHVGENGETLFLESVKYPLRDPSGEVIGLAGISRDITRQVHDEKAILDAKTEAEKNAALIQAIFESLPDHVYYKDAQARVLGGNQAWIKARGAKSIEELIGKTDLELHPAPLGQQLYENELYQIKTGETTRVRERHMDPDGKVIYMESIKSPLKDHDGTIIGLVGISRDITKQVNNERQLIIAQQEAEEANKAKSSFLAMMSHEIRTPMNGVIGASSLLLGTGLSDQQEELVHTIQVSGENLMTIINDILDYSKIEAGKIELEAVSFSLRECIENAFDLFVQPAARKNLELLYCVDPDVPQRLTGDPTRLRQIIVNLIGNAIKFTEKGEVDLHVHTLTINENKNLCQLQFSVRDTGIGISKDAQKKLFRSFTQADASSTRKYGGTGLGLAISRRLTELMGGKIWIESAEQQGSTFHFTIELPIAQADQKPRARIHAQNLHGKRILIVDDNETNRSILRAQIEQWGAQPQTFAYPEQVLSHLKQVAPYDIILLDYQMPIMNGTTLAKAIYDLPDYPPVPIIILSSSYENIPAHPSIQARMAKPIRVDKLHRQMLLLLDKRSDTEEESLLTGTHIRPKKTNPLHILVAEDNPINQRVIKMMLQRLGYENTVFVENGQEAVAAVLDADYDVILMDVQMPQMSGLEATQAIRKYTENETKPWVIALTAGVMEDERKKIILAGMNELLAKPLGVDQLEEKLDAICSRIKND
ncbi:PAS domain-containing protein [Tichowtungia aerotolerans]|uniref:histidine kinase n=1 Tax=Tichowtungia aerotolerans TaxID=2697043 RepID=A0A6P1MG21_9BACT|nr:PAS domain-containing protein [Tichowtungia aerotolerans]QHI70025.1 PAS domain-containing protein [Tichowtungia aerotolerans]